MGDLRSSGNDGRYRLRRCTESLRRLVRRPVTRRVSWGLLARVFGSLANFVLSFQGAVYLGVREFGALAAVLAVLYISQACLRATCGEVYVAVYSPWTARDPLRAGADVQAATLLVGIVAAGCIASGALLFPLPNIVRTTALAGAVVAVPLFFFDCRRFVLLGRGRTRTTAASALFLLFVQILGGAFLWLVDGASAWSLLLLYAAANAAAALTVRGAPVSVHLWRRGVRWFRGNIRLERTFLLEALAVSVAGQVVLILVTVLIGLEATAAIRTAILLLAPLTFLNQAFSQQTVAEMARIEPARRWPVSLLVQTFAVTVGAACVALVMAIPDDVVRRVIGENGVIAGMVLPGAGLYLCATLASMGPNGLLKVGGAVRALTWIRVAMGPLAVGVPVAIAQMLGSAGAVTYAMGATNATTAMLLTVAAFHVHSRNLTDAVGSTNG